ncbi:uncharacterized protein LOC121088854 [Falco naumanni]|uniref:uncharacterized protein LOC121088854 n=1 Tax=Falco naumanni TaxID=148594 RepID=UPI001ADDF292|nr:uncharacterized protein LOC121088854 [Falco naumanni]
MLASVCSEMSCFEESQASTFTGGKQKERALRSHFTRASSCCLLINPVEKCLPIGAIDQIEGQLFLLTCPSGCWLFPLHRAVQALVRLFFSWMEFSTLPDHMDRNTAAGTQRFTARSKPLERMAGWDSDWPQKICCQMPNHSFGPDSIMEILCLDLTCKNLQGRNYANSPTGFLERRPYCALKSFDHTVKGTYTHSFGFPVSFLSKESI